MMLTTHYLVYVIGALFTFIILMLMGWSDFTNQCTTSRTEAAMSGFTQYLADGPKGNPHGIPRVASYMMISVVWFAFWIGFIFFFLRYRKKANRANVTSRSKDT